MIIRILILFIFVAPAVASDSGKELEGTYDAYDTWKVYADDLNIKLREKRRLFSEKSSYKEHYSNLENLEKEAQELTKDALDNLSHDGSSKNVFKRAWGAIKSAISYIKFSKEKSKYEDEIAFEPTNIDGLKKEIENIEKNIEISEKYINDLKSKVDQLESDRSTKFWGKVRDTITLAKALEKEKERIELKRESLIVEQQKILQGFRERQRAEAERIRELQNARAASEALRNQLNRDPAPTRPPDSDRPPKLNPPARSQDPNPTPQQPKGEQDGAEPVLNPGKA